MLLVVVGSTLLVLVLIAFSLVVYLACESCLSPHGTIVYSDPTTPYRISDIDTDLIGLNAHLLCDSDDRQVDDK